MKKEYTGVDLFKVLAALGVVSIHSWIPILNTLGRLGVPFFVMISSFFFFKHYLKLNSEKERVTYLIKFEKRIGLLLLAWQIIYLPLAFYYFRSLVLKNHMSTLKYVCNFFYPGFTNANGWGQSWYLIAMLIAMPIVVKIFMLCNSMTIMIPVGIAIEMYYVLANEFGFVTHLPTWGTLYFPRVIIYIVIGFYMANNFGKISNISIHSLIICMITLLILFIAENVFIYTIGGIIDSEEVITTVPTSLMVSIFSLKFNFKISNLGTGLLRNFSTFLYCVQNYPRQIGIKFLSVTPTSQVLLKVVFELWVIAFAIVCFSLFIYLRKKHSLGIFEYIV